MQKFGYKIMKKNLADEAPVVHAAIAQQRPLEVGLYSGDAEIWEFIVATLREAVQPFVRLMKSTSGRIPTERLSFADWHALAKVSAGDTATTEMPNAEVSGAASSRPLD